MGAGGFPGRCWPYGAKDFILVGYKDAAPLALEGDAARVGHFGNLSIGFAVRPVWKGAKASGKSPFAPRFH